MSTIDIGIDEQDRTNIAQGLKRLLADSYTLYLQTHNFHWNVTGPQFRELHLMFEEHYTCLLYTSPSPRDNKPHLLCSLIL